MDRPGVALFSAQVQTVSDQPRPAPPGAADPLGNGPRDVTMRLMHAFALGDFERAAALVSEDATMDLVFPLELPRPRASGRADVIAAFQANFAVLGQQQPQLDTLVEAAGQCIFIARERGRWVPTGADYDWWSTTIIDVRDGQVTRLRMMTAAAEADAR